MVQSDDSGTYVLVCNPTAHLTVHGKDGKLLFDGSIETPEDREKVPREVWERVEPMWEKFSAPTEAPAPSKPTRPKARAGSF